MKADLDRFLTTYNAVKRHYGLHKVFNVKTPLKGVHKWYELEPKIFKEKQINFENKLINLQQ